MENIAKSMQDMLRQAPPEAVGAVPVELYQGPPRKKMRKGTKSCYECRSPSCRTRVQLEKLPPSVSTPFLKIILVFTETILPNAAVDH